MRKPKCFVSYCEKDASVEKVNAIVKYIKKLSEIHNSSVEFLFDKNLKTGEDLNQFMDSIIFVDSIIMICTPEYKSRAESVDDENKKTGVYKEAQKMQERINSILARQKMQEEYCDIDFKIFPLVLKLEDGKGSIASVPTFVQHLVRNKINNIVLEKNKNGTYKISNNSIKEYNNIFLNCISSTYVISTAKSEFADMEHHERMQNLIFLKKAEHIPHLSKQEFVSTAFYERIKNQAAYILIGRKGSGKSTTTGYFYIHSEKKYKGRIELNINNISLDRIYNFIFTSPYDENIPLFDLRRDFQEIFTYELLIEYVWLVYIHLYSMYIVCCEYKNNPDNLTIKQKGNLRCIFVDISNILKLVDNKVKWNNSEEISPILYFHALSNTYTFFNFIVSNSRSDTKYFASDIQAQLNEYSLLNFTFKEKNIKLFERVLEECKRNILFTLDGFDVAADLFRKQALSSNPEDKHKKAIFEIRWILSLLEIIDRKKVDFSSPLYRHIEICFTIPKDKFMEILYHNRDKYKYSNKYCRLDWSGIELLIMIRKRLESIINYPLTSKDKKDKQPEEIFDNLLDDCFEGIPKYITITTNGGREYKMHIFHYMLRNSFWRPRDILISLDYIMRQYYGARNKITLLTEKNVKNALKSASENIVNTDFFNEFSSSWNDIYDSLDLFKGKNILLGLSEYKDIITNKKFNLRLDGFDDPILEPNEITKFLYEIGFLGFFVCSDYMKRYNMITNQGFVFYEGVNPIKGFLVGDFDDCKIMINPVFIEKLHLIVSTEELIGINDWGTLKELEKSIRLKMSTECFTD